MTRRHAVSGHDRFACLSVTMAPLSLSRANGGRSALF